MISSLCWGYLRFSSSYVRYYVVILKDAANRRTTDQYVQICINTSYETESSRSCCSLVNPVSRSVTFGGRPAPDFVATVWNLSKCTKCLTNTMTWNFQSTGYFMCLYVTYIHLSIKHIHYTTRSILKIQNIFSSIRYRGVCNFGNPCTSRCYHQK